MDVRISVLVVNLNNLEFTKNCLEDLLKQDIPFNLRLIDQNSNEPGTSQFIDEFFNRHMNGEFYGKINYMEVFNTGFNKPLNHIWNDFARDASTEFICLLNNDVRISPNFLSSSILVLDTEKNVKVVNHTTNTKLYSTYSDKLSFIVKDDPYRQGWDITMRKSDWTEIPENIEFFYGDDFIYSQIYLSGFRGAYVLNSPMIHYERSTTEEKMGMRDCSKDSHVFLSLDNKILDMTFDEKYSKWKPEFDSLNEEDIYLKENYITRDPNVEEWENHLNSLILSQYADLLYGKVADFGCNHGAVTIIASRNEKINKLIGFDINYESLTVANELKKHHNCKKIRYHHSNLTNLSEVPSSYFDSAYSFHTLEHILPSDYDNVFSEWKRVLKSGANFIISIPYENSYDDPTHMAYFNEHSLKELFEKYGFEVIECYRDNRINFDCLNLVCKNVKKNDDILLSILVPSLCERNKKFLSDLLDTLEIQTHNKPVEIIVYSDNAKKSIGTKRNDLLKLAQGKYVSFVDDDDRLSVDYIDSILREIQKWSSDVIVFDVIIRFNGINPKLVKYGREFDYGESAEFYTRHPNHLMVHKRENICEFFKDVKTGEDDEWALRMLPRIVTQTRINKVLYHYDYDTSTKKYFE